MSESRLRGALFVKRAGVPVVGKGHLHAPDVHTCDPLHVTPHPPQLLSSVWKSWQTPPHEVWPAMGQRHAPVEHVVSPRQTFPQVPQLALSVCRLTHALPQRVVGDAQEHTLALQLKGAVHARSQRPQWLTLVRRSTQPTLSQ